MSLWNTSILTFCWLSLFFLVVVTLSFVSLEDFVHYVVFKNTSWRKPTKKYPKKHTCERSKSTNARRLPHPPPFFFINHLLLIFFGSEECDTCCLRRLMDFLMDFSMNWHPLRHQRLICCILWKQSKSVFMFPLSLDSKWCFIKSKSGRRISSK